MAIHMALQGYQVTGVDIMPSMVKKARQKADAHSVSIDCVIADMRAFHLSKQFPFIFMLMNAFQFLQTRTDYEKMLACVREHLTPDGYFLFETRNPTDRNLKGLRHPEGQRYTLPGGGQLVTTEEQHYDPLTQIQHYVRELHFSYADGRQETRQLRTALRYIFPQEMEALLHYNGFKIHTCYGNWQQDPLTATSPAMIYVCQKQS
jgi:2-polyprenyl-3-methyl-5-hydroxy-6-metoxy-1,4-benzoquinol methylase